MANIDQIRRLNYNGENIGMGFNSDTGAAVGTALDFTVPTADVLQEAVTDVSIITSHEELLSRIHMSAQLEGRYSIFSGGAKADFARNTQYNSTSTFVLASVVMADTLSRGRDFKLKPDLQRLLDTGQIDGFEEAFGDSFVRGQFSGGEFYAVMRITSVNTKVQTDLAATLLADLTSGPNSATFQGELDKKNLDEQTRSDFSVRFYQRGGEVKEQFGSTIGVAEINARLHNFPDAVKNHPLPIFIEVATYDTIPLPLPSKDREDFFLALADADSKKLKFIQLANDCEFASGHPEYFSDPPSPQVLLAMAATYTQLSNAATAHALALASGKIPPQLFDPSKLNPPLTEPELVLRRRDVGTARTFTG